MASDHRAIFSQIDRHAEQSPWPFRFERSWLWKRWLEGMVREIWAGYKGEADMTQARQAQYTTQTDVSRQAQIDLPRQAQTDFSRQAKTDVLLQTQIDAQRLAQHTTQLVQTTVWQTQRTWRQAHHMTQQGHHETRQGQHRMWQGQHRPWQGQHGPRQEDPCDFLKRGLQQLKHKIKSLPKDEKYNFSEQRRWIQTRLGEIQAAQEQHTDTSHDELAVLMRLQALHQEEEEYW